MPKLDKKKLHHSQCFLLKNGLIPMYLSLKEKEEVCGGTAEDAGSVGKMSSLSVNLLLRQSSVHSMQPLNTLKSFVMIDIENIA
jgi:hypothetical protein